MDDQKTIIPAETPNDCKDQNTVLTDDEHFEIERSLYYLGKALYFFSLEQKKDSNVS